MTAGDSYSIVVDGREHRIEGTVTTTPDVLRLGGIIGEGSVIRIAGNRASLATPGTSLDLEVPELPTFRTFRGGKLYHLRVDGFLWDWGGPAITEDEIREIAGLAENQALAAVSGGTTLRRGTLVDLTTDWPPEYQIVQGSELAVAAAVPVVVNGRSLMLEKDEVTFEDLVRLAFPSTDLAAPGMRSLTVSYRRGPLARPEGSLVSHEAIRLKKGQIFNVTATDKS